MGHSLRVQVKERTKDLQGSLDELNLAQRKLIEQEKNGCSRWFYQLVYPMK